MKHGETVFALAQHYELGIVRQGLAYRVGNNFKIEIEYVKAK
jgi:hypothetical protein